MSLLKLRFRKNDICRANMFLLKNSSLVHNVNFVINIYFLSFAHKKALNQMSSLILKTLFDSQLDISLIHTHIPHDNKFLCSVFFFCSIACILRKLPQIFCEMHLSKVIFMIYVDSLNTNSTIEIAMNYITVKYINVKRNKMKPRIKYMP